MYIVQIQISGAFIEPNPYPLKPPIPIISSPCGGGGQSFEALFQQCTFPMRFIQPKYNLTLNRDTYIFTISNKTVTMFLIICFSLNLQNLINKKGVLCLLFRSNMRETTIYPYLYVCLSHEK